jgi:hypothetical protein
VSRRNWAWKSLCCAHQTAFDLAQARQHEGAIRVKRYEPAEAQADHH